MRKNKLLIMLSTFCLVSCSANEVYGVYSFGMGKEGGTNIRASIEFKNENYSGVIGAKKFHFSMTNTESESWVSAILDQGISGYYTISNSKSKDYGRRINLGASIDSQSFPEIIDDDISMNIPTDLIEKIITVYCDSKTTTLILPVSFDDLTYQLAWYGYYIDLETTSFQELPTYKMPGFDISKKGDEQYEESFIENKIGKHPQVVRDEHDNIITNQIEEMNNNYAYEFSKSRVYDSSTQEEIGAVGVINNEYYYFSSEDTEPNSTIAGIYGGFATTFEIDKNVKSTFDNGYKLLKVTKTNPETGVEEYESDDFAYLFYSSFSFRDFHTLILGLAKEKSK